MISKEEFIRAITNVKEFIEEQDEFTEGINKLFNCSGSVTVGDKLLKEYIRAITIQCELPETNDLIEWWFWSCPKNTECQILWDPDNEGRKYTVNTPEELYEYLLTYEEQTCGGEKDV